MKETTTGQIHPAEHPAASGWAPFDRLSEQYDAWFDGEQGSRIFDVEVACIGALLHDQPRPWLEVGVGTGRFAATLDVDEGIDPSAEALAYAVRRGLRTRTGQAEALPYADGQFGAILLVVTICFLADPARALAECRRVVKPGGSVIIGLVPKNSAWGQSYERKGAEGHPFYSVATFYTTGQIMTLAEQTGFFFDCGMSCLTESPDEPFARYAPAIPGVVAGAGFVGMRFRAGPDKRSGPVGDR